MNSSFLKNSDSKNSLLKRQILQQCINEGNFSLSDLSKELNLSIPTTTRLTEELINEGFIEDLGKQDTSGGRRPSIYGLKSLAGYFVGTDIGKTNVSICITDFKGNIIVFEPAVPFLVESSESSFRNLCKLIKQKIEQSGISQESVLAYGVNLSGRVNNETGYCFTYFIGEDRPIVSLLEE